MVLRDLRAHGNAPHIVAIQEGFTTRTIELVRLSGYPYFSYGPLAKGFRIGSGLWLLSEFPISEIEQLRFRRCTGIDCMSRKGALFSRIHVPGLPTPIDFYNTHMQASYKSGNPDQAKGDRVRLKQIKQIDKLMDRTHTIGIPILFAGDFNMRPLQGLSYWSFAARSNLNSVGHDCGYTLSCSGLDDPGSDWKHSVDHHFYSAQVLSEGLTVVPHYYQTTFKQEVNGRPLSDHDAIEVHYEITW